MNQVAQENTKDNILVEDQLWACLDMVTLDAERNEPNS